MNWRWVVVLSYVILSTAHAQASDVAIAAKFSQTFRAAYVAELVARAMTQPIVPKAMRELLLKSQEEDLGFARSLIANWKSLNRFQVSADFDVLYVMEPNGFSVLKITSTSEKEFEINGRKWSVPEKGSIVRSLRQVLSQETALSPKQPSRLDFMNPLFSTAFAASEGQSHNAVAPALLFVLNRNVYWDGTPAGPSASRKLRVGDARTALSYENQGLAAMLKGQSLWDWIFNAEVAITCTNSSASGSALVGDQNVDFEARNDGTVIMKLKDRKKILFVESPKTIQGIPNSEWHLSSIQAIRENKKKNKNSVRAQFLRGVIERSAMGIFRKHEGWDKAFAAVVALTAKDKTVEPTDLELEEALKLAEDLLRSKDVVLENALLVGECKTPTCDPKPTNLGSDLRPWFQNERAVKAALNWKPKSPNSKTRIVLGETPQKGLSIQGRIADEDFDTISDLIFAAEGRNLNGSYDDNQFYFMDKPSVPYVKRQLLGLRMLGACCGDKECRDQNMRLHSKLKFIDKPDAAPGVK